VTLVLRYAARSDVGLVRSNNEDSVYAGARLLALADGMGGHAAGEVASQLVIAALAPLDDDEPGGDLLSKLDDAVRQGNTAIAAHVDAEPDLEGMGTTLTAILFAGDRIGLVHIGDSRGYLLRDGELAQITKDDTFVQTLVDEGRISAEDAHSHPQRSLIMRALTGQEVEPTLTMREARVGDRYLLCSDGLSDPVSTETILEALQIPDVTECADRLIELALRGGGPDNVTVVVADVVDTDYGQTRPILAGAVSDDGDRPTRLDLSAGRASAINPRPQVVKRRLPQVEAFTHKPRSRSRLVLAAVLLVLVVLAGLAVGKAMVYSNYFVGAHDGTVAIMRGVQGSFLGNQLQKPFRRVCVNDANALSQIDWGQPTTCHPLAVDDLVPSARQQLVDGLPAGSLDNAIDQVNKLSGSVLPLCPATAESQPSPPTTETFESVTPGSTAPGVSGTTTAPSATSSSPATPASPSSATTSTTPTTPSTTAHGGASTTARTSAAAQPSHPPPQPGFDCREAA